MRILKVAWDNCLARQDRAGTGVYAARLLEQLAHRPDLRMEVMEGWNRLSGGSFASGALRSASNLLWTQAGLPIHLWKRAPDLLHAPAFVAPVTCPCPVVTTVHDVSFLLYPSHFTGWWTTYLRAVMPPAIRSASAIICGSENSKRDIVKAYEIGCDKVRVVPYGVDHERFNSAATLNRQWAQALEIRDGYVLHVGTFSYRKNIPTLLHAVAQVRGRGKWGDRQLILAGAQNLSMKGGDEVLETIRELGLSGNVVLTGRMPDEYIPGLYAHASMLVMPSLYEGFGFPVLEAMAVGTPVICSDTPSLREVAGDAAILFPPQDQSTLASAIQDLIQNPALASDLRRKGFEQARQFTWQRTAEQTVEIYREIARS
jgi:glycosyltransferase involved in cell wall biosynthesis